MLNLKTLALATGVAAIGATAAVTPAAAQRLRGNWRVIGYGTISGRSDTDNIPVRGRQAFRQIRLCAYYAPLRLRDLRVYYRNGTRQDVNVRQNINAGHCTRNVDLRGRYRDISRVRLKYSRIYRGRSPLVRVAAR